MELRTEYTDDGSSFSAVDPATLSPQSLTDITVFEKYPAPKGPYRFRCLITDAASMPRERLKDLLQSWDTVYIHKRQLTRYEAHLRDNLAYILKQDTIDIRKKAAVFTRVSTEAVADLFSSHFNESVVGPDTIRQVEELIAKAIDFIIDIDSLSGIADLIGHDYNTHYHSVKAGWLAAVFANANQDLFTDLAGPDFKDFLLKLTVAGFLHDIGKIKIPKNILNKKGRLTNLEYICVQSHAAYSVSLLFESGMPRFAMQGILYHHENEDGSGYPCGLKQHAIPLVAKIIHMVDVFDALTSKRPYKAAKDPFEALRIMTGENPDLETLNRLESDIRENSRAPVDTIVRNEPNARIRQLREKLMMEEEKQKRFEAHQKLRDQGMVHCFDRELMKRFIRTINQSKSFDLSGLI